MLKNILFGSISGLAIVYLLHIGDLITMGAIPGFFVGFICTAFFALISEI